MESIMCVPMSRGGRAMCSFLSTLLQQLLQVIALNVMVVNFN